MDDTTEPEPRPKPSWIRTVLLCLVVVGVGAGLVFWIENTEPVAKREGASKKTAMLVRTLPAEVGTYRPEVVSLGTVMPAREVVLRARVAGPVVSIADNFEPGGRVAQDEVLVQVERAEYLAAVAQRKAELTQARADLRIEGGRQRVAKRERERFAKEIEDESLILREPQRAAAEARVQFARAAVNRADLDLKWSKVQAPFPAQILERHVDVGAHVNAGDPLARIAGTQTYWVETTVPVADLRWIVFPEEDTPGSPATVRARGAWPEGVTREARVHKLIGALDERTRMARVLVAVDDPLAEGKPPLMLGAYVEVRIAAKPLDGVVRLDRAHLRKDDTVWVMKDGKLDIREVEVRFRDSTHAFIAKGIQAGERIVVSNLSTVVAGAALREGT